MRLFPSFFLSESGAKNCHFVSLRLRSVKGEKGRAVQRSSGMEGRCLCFTKTRMRLGSSLLKKQALGLELLSPFVFFVSRRWDAARQFLAQKQALAGSALPFLFFGEGKEPFKRKETIMLAYTFVERKGFELREKPRPELQAGRDAIVRVTLGSICTSDWSVPRAVPGITVGHEMVGVVEEVGHEVTSVKPGDRVTVNVETFCGECFFCRHGYVNNCTDPHGGWALGCRIDGGQAEFVRVPYADQGLNVIPRR